MRHLSTLFISAILLSLAACRQESQERVLYLFHTNDTHSCIESLPDGTGGFLSRSALVRQLRDTLDNELLLFDGGDFSQGSLYYNLFKGEVEIQLMNLMGYDAAAIGNHEFDYGLENMARLYRMAHFPIVCANYDFTGTPLEGLIKPYALMLRKGVKVGVFGISPDPNGLVDTSKFEGMEYADPIEKANETAVYLKETEKCDLVVCLSHLGYGERFSPDEKELIARTRNIDVVLGAHSHTLFEEALFYKNADGKEVILQQMGKNGCFLGKVKVVLE